MTRTIGRVLTAAAILAIGTSASAAPQLRETQVSLGGLMVTHAAVGGVYVDAEKLVLPTTSVVGEVQVFPSVVNATEVVALGGVRQRLFHSSQGDLYAQLLLGGAAGYSRRCGICGARVTEFGLGANVSLDDRWAVRVRGDIRSGGSTGDLFYLTLGAGITRVW